MVTPIELNKCEIYLIQNKVNGKIYVGKANKYVSKDNLSWGTTGRWKSHVREALNNTTDHCRLLNAAIRKYKPDSFDVTKICDCTKEEVERLEQLHIKEYGSLVPAGYNLNEGGSSGKDSDYTRNLKSESRKTVVPTEAHLRNISLGQLGNRRNCKQRKHQEDGALPKYVNATRRGDVIIGYSIQKFPIGTVNKDYISEHFTNSKHPNKALEQALERLQELENLYGEKVQQEIKARRDQEYTEKAKAKAEKLNPPKHDYIFTIIHETKIAGYKVCGLKDTNGQIIPYKIFNNCQQNRWNLQRAEKYVQQIKTFVEKGIKIDDWATIDTVYKCDKQGIEDEHLPKYINITKYKGEKCGYVVNGYPLPNGKKSCNKFTKSKFTMEERYQQAIAYLEEIKQKHPLTTNCS
jgi:hypothetical protein